MWRRIILHPLTGNEEKLRRAEKRPVEQDVTTTLNGPWRATEEDNWQDDTDSAIMDFFKGLFQSLRAMTSFGL